MTVLRRARIRRRLGPRSRPANRATLEPLGRALGRIEPLRRAARGDPELLGRACVGAVAGALALGSSAGGPRMAPAVALGAWVGWRVALALHDRVRLAAVAEARRALPPALDRLGTCVLAGMSVERALRTVTSRTPGALGEAFTDGLRALDLGVPRARAYELIAERSGLPEVRALMTALARAERFGTSVSDTLVGQAHELRARARAAAEAEARTAPVKLIFPLVFCFLPAFVLLTIAPIAISALRTLSGI